MGFINQLITEGHHPAIIVAIFQINIGVKCLLLLLVGGLEHFSICWEFHHPNWRTHIFQRGIGQPPTSYTGSCFHIFHFFPPAFIPNQPSFSWSSPNEETQGFFRLSPHENSIWALFKTLFDRWLKGSYNIPLLLDGSSHLVTGL